MSRLRLRLADSAPTPDCDGAPDVLPFPVGWRDGAGESDALAADLLDAADATAELEGAIERMQRDIDDLREELDNALHLPHHGWRPPAA